VLGCLIEKEMTTPDYYPMTSNALLAACNQRSSRFPVVDYSETEVVAAVDSLRERGLARTVHGKGDRALKYKHVAVEILEINPRQAALLAVLLLRGPQTLGELRSRTGRYTDFSGLDEVAAELDSLADRDEPLAQMLARRPGEKEPRYQQLLGGAVPESPSELAAPADAGSAPENELAAELAALQERVARIEQELGLV
jgi:uncharacterized protein YceH (UPF0502 family)